MVHETHKQILESISYCVCHYLDVKRYSEFKHYTSFAFIVYRWLLKIYVKCSEWPRKGV